LNPEDYKIEKIGNIEKWYCKETNDLRKNIEYWSNGNKRDEAYFLNRNLHREDGPAHQTWFENGTKEYDSYWLNGKWHSKEEYDKIMLAKKFELL
jgi:hypothetical protein